MPEEQDRTKTDHDAEPKTKEKLRTLLGIEPVETKHEITVGGRTLAYTARAGAIPLKDEFGETEAEIFFLSLIHI